MPFAPRPRFTWRLRSRTLPLGERTRLMAIVNITPDSFSDGGETATTEAAVERGLAFLDDGADIVDLGAESTRPGALPVGAAQEQDRLLPVLEALQRERPRAVLSVDTYHAATARTAVSAGAEIVNDVSGLLWDPAMPETVAATAPGLVLMHTRGSPQTWHTLPPLAHADVMPLVLRDLVTQLDVAQRAGVARERIVLDPGFGFGKLDGENLALLAALDALKELHLPVLIGLSRKGFLAKTAEATRHQSTDPCDDASARRLYPTLAANVAAILGGAHILRVHDLRPAAEAAAIADAVLAENPPSMQFSLRSHDESARA